MKRYLIIGLTKQMRSIFLKDPETGKFYQKKIRKGIKYDVSEEELTFHVRRQQGFKVVDIGEYNLPEPAPEVPVEEVVAVVEEPVVEEKARIPWDGVQEIDLESEDEDFNAPPKRGKSRAKKSDDIDE